MPCSITIYVDKKTTVISVFIYAKEIAYVNPDIAPKFIKLNMFSVNVPSNYSDDLKI